MPENLKKFKSCLIIPSSVNKTDDYSFHWCYPQSHFDNVYEHFYPKRHEITLENVKRMGNTSKDGRKIQLLILEVWEWAYHTGIHRVCCGIDQYAYPIIAVTYVYQRPPNSALYDLRRMYQEEMHEDVKVVSQKMKIPKL